MLIVPYRAYWKIGKVINKAENIFFSHFHVDVAVFAVNCSFLS